jgi:hypothetical protein
MKNELRYCHKPNGMTYLEYESLNDRLNIILYTPQSVISITPLLCYIIYHDKAILFIDTDIVAGNVAYYHTLNESSNKKIVELNKMTGDPRFVESIGISLQLIYIPIAGLIISTLRFSVAELGLI